MSETKYTKEQIITKVKSILEFYDTYLDKGKTLRFVRELLGKLGDNDYLTFSPEFIDEYFFKHNDDGTKSMNHDGFNYFSELKTDMTGVSFDNAIITGYPLNHFKNVTINLDRLANKDFSQTNFIGVNLIGSLEGAKLHFTDFTDCKGNITLDPQKVIGKDITGCHLSNLTINGSFDDVIIDWANFTGSKGALINPQLIKNKKMYNVKLKDATLIGDYDSIKEEYNDPKFDDVFFFVTDFSGCKGNIVINLDTLREPHFPYDTKLEGCNITDVKIIGTAKCYTGITIPMSKEGYEIIDDDENDLSSAYYKDEEGRTVKIFLTGTCARWNNEKQCWDYIPTSSNKNLQFNVQYMQKENDKKKEHTKKRFKIFK